MILEVSVEIPADATVVSGRKLYRTGVLWKVGDSEVRDPAVGVIGNVLSMRDNQKAGRRYLDLTIEVDDKAVVEAALRAHRSQAF